MRNKKEKLKNLTNSSTKQFIPKSNIEQKVSLRLQDAFVIRQHITKLSMAS